jgi:hypothetical protein
MSGKIGSKDRNNIFIISARCFYIYLIILNAKVQNKEKAGHRKSRRGIGKSAG